MDAFTIADVSFWGPYTIMITVFAAAVIVVALVESVMESDGSLFGIGLILSLFFWGFVAGVPGTIGVSDGVEHLKTEEMSRIGYDNLTWNGDEFTGSKDGYYVIGFIKQHGDIYYVTDITRKGELA